MTIKTETAIEIVRTLSKIEQEIARYYAGEDVDSVMKMLDEQIGVLRDCIWHEVPDVLSTLMDQEEGIFRKIEATRKHVDDPDRPQSDVVEFKG